MQLDYTKTTTKPFDEVVQAVEEAAMKRSFRTLHIHNVQATLADKGFEIPHYSIIEVCNAGFAYKAISAYSPIGMMLPCRIVVFEEAGVNKVMLMKPTLMSEIMPEAELGSLPLDVEEILKQVVDEVTA
ncbi:MAG: DUF302 domain-containing protein [Bacteroidetes bacterium]|nr:DUF302 domain-containing protein [Bacteroidota bacterium]